VWLILVSSPVFGGIRVAHLGFITIVWWGLCCSSWFQTRISPNTGDETKMNNTIPSTTGGETKMTNTTPPNTGDETKMSNADPTKHW
jgi:hypothetical protein